MTMTETIILEGYEVGEAIGGGGLGTVHAARDRASGRPVAAKVIDAAVSLDHRAVARFLNEAVAASALGHPHIVDIIDVGEVSGRACLVMERLAGESLGQRLRRVQALPVADAVDFVRQAASALAATHLEGIVHGALHPENLFLTPDLTMPRGERVKVLDFGAARLPGHGGSPLYRPPEQCGDGAPEPHPRLDVYALGALLYHMLCGGPPFAADIIRPDLDQPPAAPRSLNPDIPAHVEAAMLRALARDPMERFESMAALVVALDPPPPAAPSRAPGLRAGSLVVVATAVGVLLWSGHAPGRMALLPLGRALLAAVTGPLTERAAAAPELPAPTHPRSAAPPPPARPTPPRHPSRALAGSASARRTPRAPALHKPAVEQDESWDRRH
jgi:serine/threonine protein kinase